MNEDEACEQNVTEDGIIEFGQDTGPFEECQIYKWHVSITENDGYDVKITISSLELNENAGNYLIISPGKWQCSICYNTILAQWHNGCQIKPVFGSSQYIISLCITILG